MVRLVFVEFPKRNLKVGKLLSVFIVGVMDVQVETERILKVRNPFPKNLGSSWFKKTKKKLLCQISLIFKDIFDYEIKNIYFCIFMKSCEGKKMKKITEKNKRKSEKGF